MTRVGYYVLDRYFPLSNRAQAIARAEHVARDGRAPVPVMELSYEGRVREIHIARPSVNEAA